MSAGSETRSAETLAFLFTDIEDSTPLWEQYPQAMAQAAASLDRIVSAAVEAAGGRVVGRTGDAMDAAFASVSEAATAAHHAQRAMGEQDWGSIGPLRVRMAIDVGDVVTREGQHYGSVLNRLGRILAAGHGGQVLLSADANSALTGQPGFQTRSLGEHRLKGLGRPQAVFQLLGDDLPRDFPPLRSSAKPPTRVDAGSSAPRAVRGYELRQSLGEGQFGAVYLGFQTSVGREVAIKVIRPEYANQPEFVRRFEAEAQFIAQLEHPHIVTVYDYWRDPDGAYLVMSYLRGGSLADALRRGPWHTQPALLVLEQVGSALSFAHRHGVMHGDLKPTNVLLDDDGHAYLSDFRLPGSTEPHAKGAPAGAIAYLPPEQMRGEPLDQRSDVFSLAVLTFELLSGSEPTGRDMPALISGRSDLPAGLRDVLQIATRESPGERYDSIDSYVEAIRRTLAPGRVAWSESPPGVPPATVIRNPYKGLRPFRETDASDFFGREELIQELVEAIGRHRMVAVVGSSGSGKSSVVRAGLLPALRAGALPGSSGWLATDMYPGSYPFEELEAALLRVAVGDASGLTDELYRDERGLLRAVKLVLPGDDDELLLLIDQFEELFTLVKEERTRDLFLSSLAALVSDPRSRVRVVVTLRADFLDRPLDYPRFGQLLKSSLVTVAPPGEEGLERAVTAPARNVGLVLEPGLSAEIVRDVLGEPGGLPLLQYALTELFARRQGEQLTVDAYRAAGGVVGALGRRADAVYGELPEMVRMVARQVFLRLLTLGEGVEDTRRRVPRSELLSLPGLSGEVEHILDAFGSHRLLTFDRDSATREPTIEIAHEALLRHWVRLRGWVEEARDDLRQHRRLQAAVAEWRDADEDARYLLPPERVTDVEDWLQRASVLLSDEELRFLEASRVRKSELDAAETERQAHEEALERRAASRLRVLVAVLAVGLVIATSLAALALLERNRAEEQRSAAEQQERIATARGLASASIAELSEDPERSILLATEAIQMTRRVDGTVLPEAESALRRALRASHVEQRLPTGSAISVAPDGRLATLGAEGTLTIWDPETWQPELTLEGQSSSPVQPGPSAPEHRLALFDLVDFSPDGSALVVADAELQGTVRDPATGDVQARLEGELTRPQFSSDGSLIAAILPQDAVAGFDAGRSLGVWDAITGELTHVLEGHARNVEAHAFSPDGTLLASVDALDGVRLWDLAAAATRVTIPPLEGGAYCVAFHPDGERLVVGHRDGLIQLYDTDGAPLLSFLGHTSVVRSAAFSADGERLVTVDNTSARVWDVATGREMFVLDGHTGPLAAAEFTADGERVVTTSADGTTRVWDVRVEGGLEYAVLPNGLPPPFTLLTAFSRDGQRLATSSPDGTVHIWDVATLEEVMTLRADHPVHVVSYSRDGSSLAGASAVISPDGTPDQGYDEVYLWDALGGAHRTIVTGFDTWSWDVALSPDASTVAHASDPLRAVDANSNEELFLFHHERGTVYTVAYSPNGQQLAVGAQDAGFLLDAATGQVVHQLDGVESSVLDVTFVDDQRLVTGEIDGTFRLWDVESGRQIRTVASAAGSGSSGWHALWDDQIAIAGENVLTVLDFETGAVRFDVEHNERIGQLLVSADGRYLAVVFPAHPWIHLHLLQMDDLLDLARERVTRALTATECAEYLGLAECPP